MVAILSDLHQRLLHSPTSIGTWQAGPILAVDDDVQAKLPTAKIIERVYTDDLDHSIDLTLVTAKDSLDIHDPSICLPGQGWKIVTSGTAQYSRQSVHTMTLNQDGDTMKVIYWWTGYYPPKLSSHPWVQAASRLRTRIVHSRDGESLMVRILSNSDDNNDAVINDFTSQLIPQVDKLVAEGRPST